MNSAIRPLIAAITLLLICTGGYALWQRNKHAENEVRNPVQTALKQLSEGQAQMAEQTLHDALSEDPANARAYAELGNLYLLHRSLPRAIQALETASALDPSQEHIHARLAQAYLDARWYPEAAQAVEKALKREPKSTYALLIGGELSLREDDLTTALSRFQQAMALDPNQELARVKTGFILIKLQRLDEAVAILNEGLKRSPQNSAYHYQLAETYFLRPQLAGSINQAEKHYQLALPNNPASASCHARLGELALRRSDLTVARRHWSRCLEMEPGNATALNGMAQVEAREGNVTQARALTAHLSKIRAQQREFTALSARARAENTSAESAYRAAAYALKHGMTSDAERRIGDAVRRKPEHREARELRAELYALEGRRSEARFELRVAAGLRPTHRNSVKP